MWLFLELGRKNDNLTEPEIPKWALEGKFLKVLGRKRMFIPVFRIWVRVG